jgi:hypothetical protein
MNLISKDVGHKISANRILAYIFKKIIAENKLFYTKRQILRIDDRYGFIFGAGIPFYFLKEYDTKGAGRWNVIRISSRYFLQGILPFYKTKNFENKEVRINTQKPVVNKFGQEAEFFKNENINLVLVQSIRSLLYSLRPAYDAVDLKNKFVCIKGSMSFLSYLFHLPSIFFHWKIKSKKYYHRKIEYVKFKWNENNGYFIDGEFYSSYSQEISPGPVIKFIRSW